MRANSAKLLSHHDRRCPPRPTSTNSVAVSHSDTIGALQHVGSFQNLEAKVRINAVTREPPVDLGLRRIAVLQRVLPIRSAMPRFAASVAPWVFADSSHLL